MSNSPHRLPMTFGRKPRRDLFVKEYVHDLNATQAAIRAGYSRKTAKQQGARLLTNVDLQAEIERQTEERAKRLAIDADTVLQQLSRIAFSNMLDYIVVQKDGTAFVDLSQLDRDKAAGILEITVDEVAGGTGDGERRRVQRTRFKLADKLKALDLLGRHLKLFTEKIELSLDGELLDRLAAGRRRLAKCKGKADRDGSLPSIAQLVPAPDHSPSETAF